MSLRDTFNQINSSVMSLIDAEPVRFDYQASYASYHESLQTSLHRYRHHSTNEIVDEQELRERFIFESVFLHHLGLVLSRIIEYRIGTHFDSWGLSDPDSVFAWYAPSNEVVDDIETIPSNEFDGAILHDSLNQMIEDLFKIISQRFSTEYYTPRSIASHLVDISGFNAQDWENLSIVDPACGGGIILTEVVERVIHFTLSQDVAPKQILEWIVRNIHGFDIQPFAISLTKIMLKYTVVTTLPSAEAEIVKCLEVANCFENIRLLDPLSAAEDFWNADEKFSHIIGNPPYMSTKKEFLDYVNLYKDVLYGHPNLYQLFMAWAIKAVRDSGNVSFLIPQSLLIGPYFKELRRHISAYMTLTHLTRFVDRKGIVGDADQQMMALNLWKGLVSNKRSTTLVRVSRNGNDIDLSVGQTISTNSLIQKINDYYIWIVSDNLMDYEIAENVSAQTYLLDDSGGLFSVGNGNFVWNQHKSLLSDSPYEDCLPLISAASISTYEFDFPYLGTHSTSLRPYAQLTDAVRHKIHTGQCVLIQRTTPRKVGRRLVATMITRDFSEEHGMYFLENHVIHIKSGYTDLLYGLMGWMNSDIINFIFQMRNGTAHTSVSEIQRLPIDLRLVQMISPICQLVINTTEVALRNTLITEINTTLYNELGITDDQVARIETVLSQRERVN